MRAFRYSAYRSFKTAVHHLLLVRQASYRIVNNYVLPEDGGGILNNHSFAMKQMNRSCW